MYKKYLLNGTLGLLGLSITLLVGCTNSTTSTETSPNVLAATLSQSDDDAAPRGASEIWASTCSFCHNSRSPSEFSDAQWETAMMHMRIQARLTAKDAETILAFLKAAN